MNHDSPSPLFLPASLEGYAVVFDLDDTLFMEADFVRSARREIVRRLTERFPAALPAAAELVDMMEEYPIHGPGAFDRLHDHLRMEAPDVAAVASVDWMRRVYRSHRPDIALDPSVKATLASLKYRGATLGLITDGRVETQSLKFHALGLNEFIPPHLVSISEAIGADKHSAKPFTRMERFTPNCFRRVYVGDNPGKDFRHPRALGWDTVMIAHDSGSDAIFRVNAADLPEEYLPAYTISSLRELLILPRK